MAENTGEGDANKGKGENSTEELKALKEQNAKLLSDLTSLKLNQDKILEHMNASKREVEIEDEDEERLSEDDLENLSKRQLLELMDRNIRKNIVSPIMEMIMTQQVKVEVRELKEELKEQSKDGKIDFDEYKDDIHKLILKNNKLSIKEAYILAKQQRPPKAEDKKDDKGDKGEKESKKEKKSVFGGEKPGASKSSTKEVQKYSVSEAAKKAFDDLESASE